MDLENFIDGLAQRSAANNPAQDGDYTVDGLLYCGQCKTKKQCRVEFFGSEKIVYCLCKCRADQRKAEEAEQARREKMLQIQKLRRMGFPDEDMANWTFDKDDYTNGKISEIARNYVENFDEMKKRGKGLMFFGKVGTGKTFISACIANALIDKGYPCLVTNFARLVNTISGKFEDKQDYIDSLNDFDLIVIDDLASERDTEYMGEIVQNIIDSRYRAGLPLIITTNLTADEIKHPAEIRKQRIYSRLMEMTMPFEVSGEDRRRQKLKDETSEIFDILGVHNAAQRNENENVPRETP